MDCFALLFKKKKKTSPFWARSWEFYFPLVRWEPQGVFGAWCSQAVCLPGHEEISSFLLQNGAGISSYTLMDHPAFARQLLRGRFVEPSDAEAGGGPQDVSTGGLFPSGEPALLSL